MHIPKLPDELRFADSENELLLLRDMEELAKCAESDAYKAIMLLTGSITECALTDFLTRRRNMAVQAYRKLFPNSQSKPVNKWGLDELLKVVRSLGFLGEETYKLCDLGRDYRNIIHPDVEIRKGLEPNKDRALRSVDAMVKCLRDLEAAAQVQREVVMLNIDGLTHRNVNLSPVVADSIRRMALGRGYEVRSISSLAELDKFLDNPPQDAMVFNLHGELIPIPPSFANRWRDYFQDLARHVKNDGWIWVSLAGYPFYSYGNDMEVDKEGLDAFLSSFHVSADCMNLSGVELTECGSEVMDEFSMKMLKGISLMASRCAVWQGVAPRRTFLKSDGKCGASAVKLGWGYLVQIGLLPGDLSIVQDTNFRAQIVGHLAFAFAASV